jgi:hypothetical protein
MQIREGNTHADMVQDLVDISENMGAMCFGKTKVEEADITNRILWNP